MKYDLYFQHILCGVFVLVFFVLCALCCQFLCIVLYWPEILFIIPPLIERGLYCNHIVRLSARSHFRNRYLSFYWKKWFYIWYMALAWWLVPCLPFPGLPHIYILFTMLLTNERVGVFLARRNVQHLVLYCYTDPIFCFLFLVSGGNNYMDLSDMPLDKQQQTMMWQQNQYMDSGINSGATTQVSHFSCWI